MLTLVCVHVSANTGGSGDRENFYESFTIQADNIRAKKLAD